MIETRAPSFAVHVFVAGDLAVARQTCRRYCNAVGLCVTVTEAEFIYTGGAERGVMVGLVNYPRFPAEPSAITVEAISLARHLISELCQRTALVQTPTETIWLHAVEAT